MVPYSPTFLENNINAPAGNASQAKICYILEFRFPIFPQLVSWWWFGVSVLVDYVSDDDGCDGAVAYFRNKTPWGSADDDADGYGRGDDGGCDDDDGGADDDGDLRNKTPQGSENNRDD